MRRSSASWDEHEEALNRRAARKRRPLRFSALRAARRLRASSLFVYNLCNRVSKVANIVVLQAGNVDAAVVSHIDVMLLTQLPHLLLVDPKEREHPVLARDEREITLRARTLQLSDS